MYTYSLTAFAVNLYLVCSWVVILISPLRFTTVDIKATQVQLEVVRSQGTSTDVTVHYRTQDLPASFTMKPGVKTYRASSIQDYEKPSITSIRFKRGEVSIVKSATQLRVHVLFAWLSLVL